MQLARVVRRLWNNPVAVIWVMGGMAVIAIVSDLSSGVISFVLMAQATHTLGDIGIFYVFERGLSSEQELNEGVWGIVLGLISYAIILAILPFADQGVSTGIWLPLLSIGMLTMKVQYFLLALGRNRAHSATIGAGAHVLGDLVINLTAVAVLLLAPLLRNSGASEETINLLDSRATIASILAGYAVGIYGIFRILRAS